MTRMFLILIIDIFAQRALVITALMLCEINMLSDYAGLTKTKQSDENSLISRYPAIYSRIHIKRT